MTEEIILTEKDYNTEHYKELRNKIALEKDVAQQYVIMADYFIQNYKIKTNWFTKEMYIYKDGIFEPNGECFILQEIQHIIPSWKRGAKHEIVDKIMINTYFVDNIFNKHNIIVCENGIIKLDTLALGEEDFFVDFSPDYFSTKKIPIKYDPKALCPKIDSFFTDVSCGDSNFVTYLIEILADILNNHYKSQKGHVLLGEGENGKGTFMRLIIAFVGKENKTSLGLDFIQEGSFQVYTLQNSMVNIIGDLNDKYVKDSGLVKKLLGEDFISANIKNVKKPIEFINTAKMILGGQHIMKTGEDSWAWYRRFIITSWSYKVPVDKKNDDFEKELHDSKELSGLLNKVLDRYKIFANNRFKFEMQNSMTEEDIRKNHLLKSNPVKLFIETQIITTSDEESIKKRDVYEAYTKWQILNNAKPKSENYFHKELKSEMPDIPIKQIDRVRHYIGINLVTNLSNNQSESGYDNMAKLSYKDKILLLIKKDPEHELHTDDLMKKLNVDNYLDGEIIRQTLLLLLQNGFIYEPRPDVFKIS